ncbi:hypothetical protein ScalyP_jg1914 [Parmales sp. scaly parma]|nr:hypothetical protein ScalyP_jg1914 [Parmales sp. scaly parma]
MSTHSLAYIDIDISTSCSLSSRSTAYAFVNACNTRYGLSSNDIRKLGGSELNRLPDFYASDQEWSRKGQITVTKPLHNSRIVFKLYDEICPLAVSNFKRLCAGCEPALGECGKKLTYEGCLFHRIVAGFVMQTGDFVFNNGSGGESVYGKKFKDEKNGLNLKHDKRGVLSMGNSGKNSNTSQFFITFAAAPQCDGKHVVFGEVVGGFDAIDEVEKHAGAEVKITNSGLFNSNCSPSGFWLNVTDPDSFSGFTPVFHCWPRIRIIAHNYEATERFRTCLKTVKFVEVDETDDSGQHIAPITLIAKQMAIEKEKFDPDFSIITTPKTVLNDVVKFCNSKAWFLDPSCL